MRADAPMHPALLPVPRATRFQTRTRHAIFSGSLPRVLDMRREILPCSSFPTGSASTSLPAAREGCYLLLTSW